MSSSGTSSTPFFLLTTLFGDAEMSRVFSEERTVRGWLESERALAGAQAELGVLTREQAEAIADAATLGNIDLEELWRQARNVGFPILPLIRMIASALPEEAAGRVHYGATTQDIMDTGLALQLRDALGRLDELLARFGQAVADLVEEHRHTVLAGRTHAQQAVPTTLGTKLSVLLSELARQRARLAEVRPRVCVVSLYGAVGTSAALGESASQVRKAMADSLGLQTSEVPWHVARDAVAEFGLLCASLSASCARFAREVIDLSRTEIAEVREQGGHHRGGSSTMPQKANPIGSEAIVGMSATAGALTSALYRAMEAGHERAAGEWQIEWQVVPQLACLGAGCVGMAAEVAEGLVVSQDAMSRNLGADNGLIMAEAYMMRLAPSLGHRQAHDIVYEAATKARQENLPLEETLEEFVPGEVWTELKGEMPLAPESYVGQPDLVCDAALETWRRSP
ncbi:MAG: 3-carboxy-cis,cis-muconate cycloisomerase [Actinobacteria bacterium]|nr:MAG: 3-carboxy-cis,cis-muconate cycloisomerase [Actinomycetota bacterium]